jgi:hypothetical protein
MCNRVCLHFLRAKNLHHKVSKIRNSTTGQEQKSGALTKVTDTEEDHGFSCEERHHLGKIRSSASGGKARSLLAAETSQRPSSIKSSDRESQRHGKFEVDFANEVFHPIGAEGNQFPCRLQMKEETPDGKIQKVASSLSWSSIEMDHFIETETHRQDYMNSILHVIEKARARANYVGASGPPEIEQLDENLQLASVSRGLVAELGTSRIWDSGASRGMSQEAGAVGEQVVGPPVKIHTGTGIVESKTWFREKLPMGTMRHIGLKATADTISAGQANAEKGVATSWLAPATVPSTSPGECLLHKSVPSTSSSQNWNHIVWEGEHEILNTEIISNTPEVKEGQRFVKIRGPLCATANCGCSSRKLSSAVAGRGFPGAVEDGDGDEIEEAADPQHVEVAKEALRSLAGSQCDCEICTAAKQRRSLPENAWSTLF